MSTGKQHHRHLQPRTTSPLSPLALMLLAGCGGSSGSALMSGLTINLGVLNAESNSDLANVSGSPEADNIRGDDNPNILKGRAGNDELYGEGGNDQISGGAGDDLIDGGAGFDILGGGEGDDDLQGGDGNDRLYGGDGIDVLYGQTGNDILVGNQGDDDLQGGRGADEFMFIFSESYPSQFDPSRYDHDIINDFSALEGDRLVFVTRAGTEQSFSDLGITVRQASDTDATDFIFDGVIIITAFHQDDDVTETSLFSDADFDSLVTVTMEAV